MLCDPLVALTPLQPPVAVQDVALVELQVSVDAPPLATEGGFAVRVTVAAPEMLTVAVAAVLVPPAPLQVSEYAVLAVRAPVDWLPLVALMPLQPPDAVHVVAFVELHVSVDAPPLAIEVGAALMVAVGSGLLPDLLPPQAKSRHAAQTGTSRSAMVRKRELTDI